MSLLPKKYAVTSALPPQKLCRRLKGDLIEHKPSLNILSQSKFMRDHRFESIYYGRVEEGRVEMFYHCAKKRDGACTGFYGTVTETENGSLLSGSFRKPRYSYLFAAIMLITCLLCALGTYAAGSVSGALTFIGVGIFSAALIMYDNHEKMLRQYLDSLESLPDKK